MRFLRCDTAARLHLQAACQNGTLCFVTQHAKLSLDAGTSSPCHSLVQWRMQMDQITRARVRCRYLPRQLWAGALCSAKFSSFLKMPRGPKTVWHPQMIHARHNTALPIYFLSLAPLPALQVVLNTSFLRTQHQTSLDFHSLAYRRPLDQL